MAQKKRTLKRIIGKFVNTPLVPLLFFTEAIKIGSLGGPLIDVVKMLILGVITTVIWVLSDSIDVDVDEESIVGD
jgi:predicted permease